MKTSVASIVTIALIGNVSVTQAREMGHYAPGVVSIEITRFSFLCPVQRVLPADPVDGDGNSA